MDRSQPEAVATLHEWGWSTRSISPIKKKNPKTGAWYWEIPKPVGRPDLMCTRDGWGVQIEVKDGKPSFAFDQWEQVQRDWAKEHGLRHHLWFWLCLGMDAPNRNPEAFQPRQSYLFPYTLMLEIEDKIKPYQNTLSYQAKHTLKEIQERGLSAPVLLATYRLSWKGYGKWELPAQHPFQIYSRPLPYFSGLSETLPNEYIADSHQQPI